jgi:beta-lactamase superfamily II metal-dependent hydrolase
MARGDGKLYVSIIEMGQGDCIMVSLPNGKTLMIDCGTARWARTQKEIMDMIFDDRFLNKYNTIDALILTHPDKDHCNQLMGMLIDKKPKIKSVYYSFGNLTYYTHGSAGGWLATKADVEKNKIYSVAINASGKKFNGITIPESADPIAINVVVTRSGKKMVKILHGTSDAMDAKDCEVFILAGDVDQYPGIADNADADGKNRRSVVTMIVFGNKKLLFCGDATFHAEKFLKDTYQNYIKNIDLLQVAHHGSIVTSSSCNAFGENEDNVKAIGFVDHVNAESVVISAAEDSGAKLGLPRHETIDKFINIPNKRIKARPGNAIGGYRFIEATYDTPVAGSKKRKILTQGGNTWSDYAVAFDIISTGSLGTIDYDVSDADA